MGFNANAKPSIQSNKRYSEIAHLENTISKLTEKISSFDHCECSKLLADTKIEKERLLVSWACLLSLIYLFTNIPKNILNLLQFLLKIKQTQINDIQTELFDVSAQLKNHTVAIEENLKDDRKGAMERAKGGISHI